MCDNYEDRVKHFIGGGGREKGKITFRLLSDLGGALKLLKKIARGQSLR